MTGSGSTALHLAAGEQPCFLSPLLISCCRCWALLYCPALGLSRGRHLSQRLPWPHSSRVCAIGPSSPPSCPYVSLDCLCLRLDSLPCRPIGTCFPPQSSPPVPSRLVPVPLNAAKNLHNSNRAKSSASTLAPLLPPPIH
jgi:hypothetical protein